MSFLLKHVPAGIAWLLVIGLFMGCAADDEKPDTTRMRKIEGSVWYRERMLPPPNAEIYVALEDVARMDVPAQVIASTRLTPQGGPPWDFAIAYDPARLHDRGRYALRVRIEADKQLLFINTQHIPAFNRDPGAPLKIMVSRVAAARTVKAMPPSKPNPELVNTYWRLTELSGKPAEPGAGQEEMHMVLTLEGERVRGFSGCNQFSGTYVQKDDQLHFGPMAATMMACVEGMQQEQAFLEALGKTTRYTINGENLVLFDAEAQLILRFKAVYLK